MERLLLMKNNLNYAFVDGYLSINPHALEQSFPVRLWNHGQHLDFWLLSAVDRATDIPFDTCQAREIVTDIKDFLPRLKSVDDTAVDLTDINWVKGVAKGWATAFFVTNTSENISKFTIGKRVRFADGTIRQIQRQEALGKYLNVYLDGLPLDGAKVGFPNKIEVVE